MAKIALVLDKDVRPVFAEILRQRGYSALHVLELERTGRSDAEQLTYAVNNQRAILTHNLRDFILLDRQYKEIGQEHFGILFSDQVPLREVLRKTIRFLGRHDAEEIRNKVCWLN